MTFSRPLISTASMDSLSGTLLCFELPKSRHVPSCTLKICSQVALLMGFKSLIHLCKPTLWTECVLLPSNRLQPCSRCSHPDSLRVHEYSSGSMGVANE